jgi:hypothetical protein
MTRKTILRALAGETLPTPPIWIWKVEAGIVYSSTSPGP